jgi:hypothetical protein
MPRGSLLSGLGRSAVGLSVFGVPNEEGIGTGRTNQGFKEAEPFAQELLRESVIEGLKGVLGESPMRAVLFHLGLNQFATDARALHEKLRSTFLEGSVVLEKAIVKELWATVGIPHSESKHFDFEERVKFALQVRAYRKEGISK